MFFSHVPGRELRRSWPSEVARPFRSLHDIVAHSWIVQRRTREVVAVALTHASSFAMWHEPSADPRDPVAHGVGELVEDDLCGPSARPIVEVAESEFSSVGHEEGVAGAPGVTNYGCYRCERWRADEQV